MARYEHLPIYKQAMHEDNGFFHKTLTLIAI